MKTINIAKYKVPFSEINKGQCYLYSAVDNEENPSLYMKASDDYHKEYNAFNLTNGFFIRHTDDCMVTPVDVEINVTRK